MRTLPHIASLLLVGTAWAAVLWGGIRASTGVRVTASGGHGFRVDESGNYRINPSNGNDLYALSRYTESIGRMAHFLFWPLEQRCWGEWVWTEWAGSGRGRTDVPAPTEEQFVHAAADMDRITRVPGLDYMKVCVPGGPFSQTVYYTPGVVALLAFSYLLTGPVTLAVVTRGARGLRRRRVRRRVAAGLCPVCGYSTAGAGLTKCPECGVSAIATQHAV
ncbi:MAG TPA: hypothetical protein VEB22_03135 [Phycisphaerales bacterium]|nr:hypothetical protein [Phycisphaerales bacterium]